MSRPVDSFLAVHPDEQHFRELIIESAAERVGRVDFTFIEGGDTYLEESDDPIYNRQAVLGRPAEYLSYQGSESRSITLLLRFFAETNVWNEVYRPAHFFSAVKLPWRNPNDPSSLVFPPPLLQLRLGDFLDIPVYLTECDHRWMRPVLLEDQDVGMTMAPMGVEIDVTLVSPEVRMANQLLQGLL